MGRTACTEPQCLYKGALYLTLPFTYGLTDKQDNKARRTQTNEILCARPPFFLWTVLKVNPFSQHPYVFICPNTSQKIAFQTFTFSIIIADVKVFSRKLYDTNFIQCHFHFAFSNRRFISNLNPLRSLYEPSSFLLDIWNIEIRCVNECRALFQWHRQGRTDVIRENVMSCATILIRIHLTSKPGHLHDRRTAAWAMTWFYVAVSRRRCVVICWEKWAPLKERVVMRFQLIIY